MNDSSSVYNHYFSVLKFFLSITVRNIVNYLIYILSGRLTPLDISFSNVSTCELYGYMGQIIPIWGL